MSQTLQVAFVTGGHGYDVRAMHEMLRAMPGMDVYPMHMDDWACGDRAGYDVVVFYHMLMDSPTDEGPWYRGKVKTALEELGQKPMGIVVLHHARSPMTSVVL